MLQGYLQIAIFVAALVALVKPVGIYLARVFGNERVFLTPVLGPIERLAYRAFRVRPEEEGQDWKEYARSLIVFSLLFWVLLYLILRTQGIQPFNPQGFRGAPVVTPKPKGLTRVFALGDSNTFGWTVDDGANWPAQLHGISAQCHRSQQCGRSQPRSDRRLSVLARVRRSRLTGDRFEDVASQERWGVDLRDRSR